MAYAAAAIAVITAVVGTVQAKQQADYQEDVAKNNQAIAENNADRAVYEAQIDAADQDQEANAVIGQLIADAGASGLSLDSGSKALQIQSAQKLAAQDRARIRYAGDVEATNLNNQARQFAGEASMARSAGRFALVGGGLNVASSLISGASKTGSFSSLSRTT